MVRKKATNSSHSESSLRQLQDLLLEGERKAVGDRLTELERSFKRTIKTEKTEWRRALRELEKSLRREIEALAFELAAEAELRETGDADQKKRLDTDKQSVRARVEKVEGESKQRAAALRGRISEVTRKLRDEQQEREDRLLAKLQNQLATIAQQSAPKEQLAAMFAELAERFREDGGG